MPTDKESNWEMLETILIMDLELVTSQLSISIVGKTLHCIRFPGMFWKLNLRGRAFQSCFQSLCR